jgi:hypothetical protein
MLSTTNEQDGHPSSPRGVEHEVVDQQLATVLDRSTRLAVPCLLSNMYGFEASTIGSPRRSAFNASRRRVNSFSFCAKWVSLEARASP